MSHDIPETGPLPWTSLGILRQQRVVAEAKARYDAAVQALGSQEGVLHEEQRLEALPSKDERDLLRHIWKAAEVLYGRLQPLPKTITTNRGCTGLVVKLAHQSDEMIEKRGNTEILGLGGPGENDTESKLRIFGINSPIGAALKGKDVGDIVRVFTPDDGHYDVEILSLETLTAFLERLPTSMDGLDAAQLELGFGTSPA